jgi:hypothetical protein
MSVARLLLGLLLVAGCASPGSTDPGYAVSMETQPAPMQSGRFASVIIRVEDEERRPVTGAKVTFNAQHTGMQHGAGGTVTGQEREPGVYSGDIIPPMSGKYSVKVVVDSPAGKSERTLETEVR